MKLFNNPEMKSFFLIYSLLSAVFIIICYFIEPVFSVILLVFSVLSLIFFLIFTKKRYSQIKKLTDAIDKILQGKELLSINKMKEGELSILETQVEKMFIRLKEQQDILKKEKHFLADSIADLSHQLRTPLTSINLILSLISDPEITGERKNELLRELSSLIGKTQNLVTTLLKISKLDAGTIEFNTQNIYVKELINKAVEPLLITMDIKNISLITKTEGVSFKGDFLWLTEAFSNILKNAVEHTPENGTITVTATKNPLYTEISVSDTGSGFDEKDIPRIFDRFYKGKNTAKESFGIGLNLAKTVITNCNGTIKAANSPEGGATFTVKIYQSDETVI